MKFEIDGIELLDPPSGVNYEEWAAENDAAFFIWYPDKEVGPCLYEAITLAKKQNKKKVVLFGKLSGEQTATDMSNKQL